MNFYRDKVTIRGTATRANVYVASTDRVLSGGNALNKTVITVTIPPSKGKALLEQGQISRIIWQGSEYNVEGLMVPIMALGRVDHYRITAANVVGA